MPSKGQETDIIGRLWGKSVKHGEHNLWQGKVVGNGYGAIWYKGKTVRINRLICHLYHGADLDDQSWVAAHIPECPYRNCWTYTHLYVTTTYQNVQDQIAKGNFHYGTANLIPNFKDNPDPPTGPSLKKLFGLKRHQKLGKVLK